MKKPLGSECYYEILVVRYLTRYSYQSNMTDTLNNPAMESQRPTVQELLGAAGYKTEARIENVLLNAINYFRRVSVANWEASKRTQDEYFSQLNVTFWQQQGLEQQGWRSWNYQVCTEWGFIQTGSAPPDIMPLISRTIDLEYGTFLCRAAFNINTPPNITEVNKYGAYDIEYERLAIIGGNADPWKPATPLADRAKKRTSTTQKPVLEITPAVHHWEENGVFENKTRDDFPPSQVKHAQQFIKDFVIEWLKGMWLL